VEKVNLDKNQMIMSTYEIGEKKKETPLHDIISITTFNDSSMNKW